MSTRDRDAKKKLGQYFTTHEDLLEAVRRFVQREDGVILEPSRGAGHIVAHLCGRGERRPWRTVEIDDTIDVLATVCGDGIDHTAGDFLRLKFEPDQRFATIVGNPPYVKVTRAPNLYLQFLDKCLDLLDECGEMVMVIPTDFLTATGARAVRERMWREGRVTHLYRPNNETLFKKASQDVIVLRFQREPGPQSNESSWRSIEVNGDASREIRMSGGRFFLDSEGSNGSCTLGDLFDIKVGMVSGADDVFRNDALGNVAFWTRNGDVVRYILIDKYPSGFPDVDAHLLQHKKKLMDRKIRAFHERNWFEWGALRNREFMEEEEGDQEWRIYMETLTRKERVAFVGRRMHFDGNLLCLAPKAPMTRAELESWADYFNSEAFRRGHMQSGRFKMGQGILREAPAPSLARERPCQ
jgi:adenine-specific DNA-methyltransferase